MSPNDIIAAMKLPAQARIDQRVPKKLLLERGTSTAADKRAITEGVDECRWVAALKPATIGVPAFRDDTREYLEVAVMTIRLRRNAKTARIVELVHRAVPYPVVLVAFDSPIASISLAHKRWSLGERNRTVLEGAVVCVELGAQVTKLERAFLDTIALDAQSSTDLRELYERWIQCAEALLAAHISGSFRLPNDLSTAARRRAALDTIARVRREIEVQTSRATQETQISRLAEANVELGRLRAILAQARQQL